MDFITRYRKVFFTESLFLLKVKAGAKKTELLGVAELVDNRHCCALYLAVKEPAQEFRANKAIVKFFKKNFKINVSINSGQNSKLKVLEVVK